MSGDHQAIHPGLRLALFSVAVQTGGATAYEAVKKDYLSTTSVDGKEIGLQALGYVQTSDLVNDFMDFQLSDKVAVQDMHSGAVSLAAHAKVRDPLWTYIKAHWEDLYAKLSVNSTVMDRFVKNVLSKYASHEMEQDIAAFFKEKNTKGYDRGLGQVSNTVSGNANYKERDEKLVLEWLQAHGYA